MDPKSSRLVTTTLLGVVFGIICMLLSRYSWEVAYWPIGVSFLLHHAVMGLAIGASSLKMNWFLFRFLTAKEIASVFCDPFRISMMPITPLRLCFITTTVQEMLAHLKR